MKQRGMTFTGPSIPALLSGAKTQTRRLMREQPPSGTDPQGLTSEKGWEWLRQWEGHGDHCDHIYFKPPHAPGDLIWVREAWRTIPDFDGRRPADIAEDVVKPLVSFLADGEPVFHYRGRYRNARFLPRRFARIWLRVLDVQPERLEDISPDDIAAEGVAPRLLGHVRRQSFVETRDRLHKPPNDWAGNPWVWRIGFERTERPS